MVEVGEGDGGTFTKCSVFGAAPICGGYGPLCILVKVNRVGNVIGDLRGEAARGTRP